MSIKRLRALSGADGDESREDKNERIFNDKLADLLEEYNLIVRDSRRRISLSPILDTFLDKVHAYKMLIDDDVETSDHHNTFPIAQNLDILPAFACYDVDIAVSGDNDGVADISQKPKDILPKAKIIIDSPAANVLHMFNLRPSSSLSFPTQLYCGKTGLPFVTPLINQLQLVNENKKSIIQNSSRDDNPLYLFAENFYSDIWSEYNDTTDLESIIQDQIKNLLKTPIPQLPNFDDAAASVLDVIDWIFKMASFFSQMNIFYSEMITLPLPFQKNDRSPDLDIKYPYRSAIVIMDNALTRIYLEAISTNKVIITSIPH